MNPEKIMANLPYSSPFLFVDGLSAIDETGIQGHYTFPLDAFFYKGHFESYPVTPGVILTECMAQIGLVSLGIYLLKEEPPKELKIAMSNCTVDFYLPVFPGEKVRVKSEKIYFRFQKLKCSVEMYNTQEKLVCKGEISGMIQNEE